MVFSEYVNFTEEASLSLKKIPDKIHLNSFLNYVAIWYEAIAQALNAFRIEDLGCTLKLYFTFDPMPINQKYHRQGCHGQFLAGKAITVAAISGVLPPPLSILQNPGKALPAAATMIDTVADVFTPAKSNVL